MIQLDMARNNEISNEMKIVTKEGNMSIKDLMKKIADGKLVTPPSRLHKNLDSVAIGEGLSIKVNANIGFSPDKADLDYLLEKLIVCIDAETDRVMDISTSGDIDGIRKKL